MCMEGVGLGAMAKVYGSFHAPQVPDCRKLGAEQPFSFLCSFFICLLSLPTQFLHIPSLISLLSPLSLLFMILSLELPSQELGFILHRLFTLEEEHWR